MQLGVRPDSAGSESAQAQTYHMRTDISAGQQRRGRPFQPGQSGNPRGRPAGSRNHITLMLDRLAEADAVDVLRAIVAKAKEGDSRAAELLEQLEVGSDQHADAQTGRWPHRSTSPPTRASPAIPICSATRSWR